MVSGAADEGTDHFCGVLVSKVRLVLLELRRQPHGKKNSNTKKDMRSSQKKMQESVTEVFELSSHESLCPRQRKIQKRRLFQSLLTQEMKE